jgi:hypothetical protein
MKLSHEMLLREAQKLLLDIDKNGLRSGGEEYPNALCLHDLANRIDNYLTSVNLQRQEDYQLAKNLVNTQNNFLHRGNVLTLIVQALSYRDAEIVDYKRTLSIIERMVQERLDGLKS